MNRIVFAVAFAIGLVTVGWVGLGFVGASWMALAMTLAIAGVYMLGAFELTQFRAATASLASALEPTHAVAPSELGPWLDSVHPGLRNTVRSRIEGERVALPGPALTPYLVGLLVMLGMLGTFLGMVVTFKGAVFALEGSTDLQAIRSALAAPIKGLGLSFGTSVAGVAASAMLGLLSALSRRERVNVARLLDARIATVFRPFSLAHQRQETFKALQAQAHALPHMVDTLQAMMTGLERRSQQLDEQLLAQQAQFHRDVSVAYTGLAETVGQSLQDSLKASAQAAGDSIRPVVENAMSAMAQESTRMHQRQVEAAQTQLDHLSAQFSATVTQSQQNQALADDQRLSTWTQALHTMAHTLQSEWQHVGAQTLAQQQAVCLTLEQTADKITERASHQASQTLDQMTRLLHRSEDLMRSRIESEALWLKQQADRMDQLAHLWRTEIGTLRDDEAARGQAAVDRLGELQAALASQLATLGAALEGPMTRMLQTATEVPQAAADVIAQLRQEMARLTERDNLALEERAGVMARIGTLLQSLNQASGEQRVAIESLVASAAAVLDQAGSQFTATLEAQSHRTTDAATQVTASAIELSSLGESFTHGIQLFSATNEKLMDSLQRIEGSLKQSLARSDEQLAYYVAQAREVIDLSITSQQGIVEDLRRLHSAQAALAEGNA